MRICMKNVTSSLAMENGTRFQALSWTSQDTKWDQNSNKNAKAAIWEELFQLFPPVVNLIFPMLMRTTAEEENERSQTKEYYCLLTLIEQEMSGQEHFPLIWTDVWPAGRKERITFSQVETKLEEGRVDNELFPPRSKVKTCIGTHARSSDICHFAFCPLTECIFIACSFIPSC